MKRYILFILLCLTIGVKSQTGFCFNMPNSILTPTISMGPSSHTNGDFNNDGHIDIAAINSFSSSVSILFGAGNGHFNSISTYSLSGNPTFIISADFNQDNYLDLAVAHQPNTVSILLGTTSGSFALPAVYFSASPKSITCGDFNEDGNLDIVSCGGTNKINFLFGSSTGTFVSTPNFTLSNASTPYLIDNADFDNDGNLDIVTKNSSNISVLRGNGSGGFISQSQYNVGASPVSMSIDDVNNDGFIDIITSGITSTLLLNNTVGGFSAQSLTISPNSFVATGDLNLDGNKDLLTVRGNIVGAALGNGLGAFGNPHFYSTVNTPNSISISDFNEDGNPDLSVGSLTENRLAIHFGVGNGCLIGAENYNNTGSLAMCSGDFNMDGKDDLASCQEYNDNNLVTYLGTDSGTLSSQVVYPNNLMANLDEPNEIIYEDFNNDGNSDLMVSNNDGGSYPFISLFVGSGTGFFTFSFLDTLTQNEYLHSMTASDFNLDGYKDLAISTNSSTIYLLLGTVSGTFNHSVINLTTTNTQQLKAADFNGDNKPDLAAISGGQFLIFNGIGNGLFLAPISYSVGVSPYAFAISDFDLDGNLDVVVNSNGTTTTLLGIGNGTFNNTGNNPLQGMQSGGLKAGDFNSDGKPDLVKADAYGLIILEGVGNGQFYNPVSYPVGPGVENIITIDVNGDQRLDLVTSFSNSIYIALLINGPVVTTNLANSICSGSSLTLTAYGASTYTWSSGAISNTIAITPSAPTTFTIIGSDLNGCLTTETFSVNVLALPSVSIAPVTSSICISTSALVSVSGANSYLWSTGATTSTINVMPTTTTIYSVTGTDGNNCSNTASVQIVVNPNPSISVTSSTVICNGSSASLMVSGANTYSWSTGATTNSITETPSTTTIYSVTGTDANNCTGTATTQIAVNPNPIINLNNGTICEGQSFTITPTGANTYTYSGGSDVVNPNASTNYTVTGEDLNNCIGTATTQIIVNPNPTVTVVSNSVCVGTSASLTASGAASYSWSTGAITNSITETPTITTTYSVTGTGINNCSNTQTVSITVDNTCQDVWPGDANSDGTTDNLDVLELGLHYTQTGTPRASVSNAWQSYFSNNWTGTITNGKNVNHSNCNGDGIINDNDTLAIYNNYGLTHAFKAAETNTVNPQLTIVPDQSMVAKGNWGSSSIYLGDVSNAMNNLNGVAFTALFDNSLIETDSVYIEYQNSFIGLSAQNLKFRKPDFANGKIYVAITHTLSSNVSGYGKIATLHYKIKSNLAIDAPLNLSLTQANQSDASGVITPLSSGSASLMAIGASVGLNEISNSNLIAIQPNPSNGMVVISSTADIEKIEVLNLAGQILVSENTHSKTHQFNLENLANGVYFVKVYNSQKHVSIKKLVVQK